MTPVGETIELRFPVEVDGVRHERLHMRRATTRDLNRRARNCTALERGLLFAAMLCDVDHEVILALDEGDGLRVGQALNRQIDGLFQDLVLGSPVSAGR